MEILQKFRKGQKLNPSDWEAYLKDTHKRTPSMTPYAFSSYCTKDGLNSYEWLARNAATAWENSQAFDKNRPVDLIDLACGDGFLYSKLSHVFADFSGMNYTGIDMSEGELSMAAEKIGYKPNVNLLCERAQDLSLADASQDIVVSHMAFMLMNPASEVLREIDRVLRPGGKFLAVIASRKLGGEFMQASSKLMIDIIDQNIPNLDNMPVGDPLVRSREGLMQLMQSSEDNSLALDGYELFELQISDKAEYVWRMFRDMYFVDLMPNREIERLRLAIISLANQFADAHGRITYEFPMILMSATKQARVDA